MSYQANSKLVNNLEWVLEHREMYNLSQATLEAIKQSELKAIQVFHYAGLFPRDSFKTSYIQNGKVEERVKLLFVDGEVKLQHLMKVEALRMVMNEMDELTSKDWRK